MYIDSSSIVVYVYTFCTTKQLTEELEDSRSEVQKYKRQLQRLEQSVQKLEEELSQVKSSRRRHSDIIQAEDFKQEIDRCVRMY